MSKKSEVIIYKVTSKAQGSQYFMIQKNMVKYSNYLTEIGGDDYRHSIEMIIPDQMEIRDRLT